MLAACQVGLQVVAFGYQLIGVELDLVEFLALLVVVSAELVRQRVEYSLLQSHFLYQGFEGIELSFEVLLCIAGYVVTLGFERLLELIKVHVLLFLVTLHSNFN